MPKSIRNGAALLAYCPASIAAIEGRYSLAELVAERIAAHAAIGLDRDVDQRRPGLIGERFQRTIDVERGRIGGIRAGLLE